MATRKSSLPNRPAGEAVSRPNSSTVGRAGPGESRAPQRPSVTHGTLFLKKGPSRSLRSSEGPEIYPDDSPIDDHECNSPSVIVWMFGGFFVALAILFWLLSGD